MHGVRRESIARTLAPRERGTRQTPVTSHQPAAHPNPVGGQGQGRKATADSKQKAAIDCLGEVGDRGA